MSLREQFRAAPVYSVVPLSDDLRDPHFVGVEKYPEEFREVPLADGEVGALCILHHNVVHAVCSRLVCKAAALPVRELSEQNPRTKAKLEYAKDDARRYVAASVPGAPFMDRRAQ